MQWHGVKSWSLVLGFAGGLAMALMIAAVWSSQACTDVSEWSELLNGLGYHVPHHLVLCAAP